MLCCEVTSRPSDVATNPRARRSVAALAAAAHSGKRGARDHCAAGQHHGDQCLPALARELLQRRYVLQPGIVDQQVRTVRRERCYCCIDALLRCDVEPERRRDEPAGAQVGGSLRRGRGIEVRQAHRAAAFGKVSGDAEPDPAPGPRDQHPERPGGTAQRAVLAVRRTGFLRAPPEQSARNPAAQYGTSRW